MGLQRRYVALIGLGCAGALIALLHRLLDSAGSAYSAATPQIEVSRRGLTLTIPCPGSVTGAVYLWRDLALEILKMAVDGADVRRERWCHLCMDWYLSAAAAVTSSVPPVYVIVGTLDNSFYRVRCEASASADGYDSLFYVYYIPRRFRRLDVTYAIHVPPDGRAVCTQSVTFLRKPVDAEGCSVPVPGGAVPPVRGEWKWRHASDGTVVKDGAP